MMQIVYCFKKAEPCAPRSETRGSAINNHHYILRLCCCVTKDRYFMLDCKNLLKYGLCITDLHTDFLFIKLALYIFGILVWFNMNSNVRLFSIFIPD